MFNQFYNKYHGDGKILAVKFLGALPVIKRFYGNLKFVSTQDELSLEILKSYSDNIRCQPSASCYMGKHFLAIYQLLKMVLETLLTTFLGDLPNMKTQGSLHVLTREPIGNLKV